MTFDELEPRLLEAGRVVARTRLQAFEVAKRVGSSVAYGKTLGFSTQGQLGSDDGPAPSAPIKFAINVAEHVGIARLYLPYFAGVKTAFEIGVGGGYLMRALIDVMGVTMTGCDVQTDKKTVFTALRTELGLNDRVIEHRVVYKSPIPIPAKTEAVIAFLPAFDIGWSPRQYDWFHEECWRHGVSRVFWRLNSHSMDRRVRDYFHSVGKFPTREDHKRFVIVRLRPWRQRLRLRIRFRLRAWRNVLAMYLADASA